MEVDNFIKRMAKVMFIVQHKKMLMHGYSVGCVDRFRMDDWLFNVQATGVAITEVRDAGREENGQSGGVRRLALNRCLSRIFGPLLILIER